MIDYSWTKRKKGWRGLKQFLTLLSHSLTSLIGLFSLACCFTMSLVVATLWDGWFLACCESRSKLMAYEGGIEAYCKWCLLLSLHRYSVIGMRSAMASISSNSEVWKAPVICRAALHYIFFSSVMFLMIRAPLKNHSWNLYRVMGRMQVLYCQQLKSNDWN